MKDKLYKTNKKAIFYRLRNTAIAIIFLAIGAAALTVPYPYVTKAINAYQEKRDTSHIEDSPISEDVSLPVEKNI